MIMAINAYFVIFGRLTMEKPLHEKICLPWFEADWLFYSQKQGWMHMLVFALLFEHHAIIPCTPCFPYADPGFSSGGVRVNLKKKPWQRFFLVLSLFYWSQMVNFEENYHFSRFQRGSNFFQGGGGVQLFPGGSNCLYPIETHITCDFPWGSDPLAPLWIRTCYLDQQEMAIFPLSRLWVVFFSFI